jgi:rubrerythrin
MNQTTFHDGNETLRFALQAERDAVVYYAEAAENSSGELGRNMFLGLVEDEKKHVEWIEALLRGEGASGNGPPAPAAKQRFETMFTEAKKAAGGKALGTDSDLAALDRAAGMEKEGFEYYAAAARQSPDPGVKELCKALAEWEDTHFELIQNTKRYLADPGDWFTWEEGPMLDGGGAFA